MGFSRQLSLSLSRYVMGNKLRGKKRFPLVLMLEPTFRCNLACAGCGRIREYRDIVDQAMSADECLKAVDESGAPVVSITGGEPLLLPDIGQIVEGIIARKRFVNLCTNGLLLESSLGKFKPGPYMSFVLHLDGLAESHDGFAGRKGVFDTAVNGIKAAKQAGFQVLINTTIYKQTKLAEIEHLFTLLSRIPVDGIMTAPAFSYEAVGSDVFMSRREIVKAFQPVYRMRERFRFYNTPVYLDFLAGKKELRCTPWSTPTRNPKGWKRPCYLVTDGHCGSFRELMEDTSWEKYGAGNDPRCANCMVHCGFEASALDELGKSLPAIWQTVRWNFSNHKYQL
ncbi:MAG: adenosyl-hopene transferase HpnH [Chloroflexi bacterium]|nr:adenosyl-hopene transferase HpnH [Chloroflexota bacterium]